MNILTDCTVSGGRSVLIRKVDLAQRPENRFDDRAVLLPNRTSYDLLREGIDRKLDICHLARSEFKAQTVNVYDLAIEAYHSPLKPLDDRDAVVSAFGNTHVDVNGRPVRAKELDWFYKGGGETIRLSGETIKIHMNAYGGGIEIEYALVLMISGDGTPIPVGYVLANDFSDVELRKRHPNLASLSKLNYTYISRDLVLGTDIPQMAKISCALKRGQDTFAWKADGQLGRCVMKYTTKYLIDVLFQNKATPPVPFSVYYLLLGAALSSSKAGVELLHRDVMKAECHLTGMSLVTPFEDEAVTSSCC